MARSVAVIGRSWATHRGVQAALAVLIILGFLTAFWYQARPAGPLLRYDQPVYLSIAYDLIHLGRFTNGSKWAIPHVDPTRPPGMDRTPLYPAFLAATALLDPAFNKSLSCFVQHSAAPICPQQAPLPRILQFVMTIGVYLMLWRIAARASGSWRIGWLSLGLGLVVGPILIRSVDTLMTETLTLFLTTAATMAAVEAIKAPRSLGWILLAGVMVGLAGMTRPIFTYLLPVVALAVLPLILLHLHRWRNIRMLATFLLGGAIVTTPWIVRDAVVLDRPALASGYASSVLTQRVAFDLMNWHQYALFYLCALPDGSGMGSLLIKPDACKPFQYEMIPGTFYDTGNTTFMRSTIIAAGGEKNQLGYLLRHYIIADPIWHAMVSIPMIMEGLWIGHYWGMITAILCILLTLRSLLKRDMTMLVVTLPGWFMLLLYAAVSVNSVRYNLMLIIPFSLAGGMALDGLLRRNDPYRGIICISRRIGTRLRGGRFQ